MSEGGKTGGRLISNVSHGLPCSALRQGLTERHSLDLVSEQNMVPWSITPEKYQNSSYQVPFLLRQYHSLLYKISKSQAEVTWVGYILFIFHPIRPNKKSTCFSIEFCLWALFLSPVPEKSKLTHSFCYHVLLQPTPLNDDIYGPTTESLAWEISGTAPST